MVDDRGGEGSGGVTSGVEGVGALESGSGICTGTAPTRYWWDSVCFDKGAPVEYPHPDRPYYGITTVKNFYIQGSQLEDAQIGTAAVTYLYPLLCSGYGVAFGAGLGALGGPLGAAAGALVGLILGNVACYIGSLSFQDESGTSWIWANLGFISAAANIPYIILFFGTTAVNFYLISNLHYLRIGTWEPINQIGLTGP